MRMRAACLLIGGLVWTLTALVGLGAADGSSGFYVAEASFIAVHVLVLTGLVALAQSSAAMQRWARRGLWLAVVGRVLFVVAEAAAIIVGKDELPVFPPAVAMTGVGMVVGGIGIARTARWAGWRRWTPLAMGVYPFLAIIPLFAVTGDRPDAAVAGWGLVQAAVGLAMTIECRERRLPGRTLGDPFESTLSVRAS